VIIEFDGNAFDEEQIVSSLDETLQDPALSAVTVPLRLEWSDDVIRVIPLTVIDLGNVVQEIRLNGQVIGFIHRADHIFVALSGARMDRAEECGQSLLWDKAAATLVTTLGQTPEPEESVARVTARERSVDTGHDTSQQSARRPSRSHAITR